LIQKEETRRWISCNGNCESNDNERQALVREELKQEMMKTATEKESQIDEEKSSSQTIVLMANHHHELVNTPCNAKRRSDRMITT